VNVIGGDRGAVYDRGYRPYDGPRGRRGAATLAAELYAAAHGADYIRTHDPGALRDGLRVMEALAAEASGDPRAE
jgi:dihydropteroate synthase